MNTDDTPLGAQPPKVRDDERRLAEAIGAQIREFRQQLRMTVVEVAGVAGLSAGMLSKIERGVTSPSLSTLTAVAAALNVPVTSLFRRHEEQRDCAWVRAGEGLVIERAGTRAGHEYRLLGHSIRGRVSVEPYLVTLSDESEVFPLFQHPGVEFIYILEGEVLYRHGKRTYALKPGDSLFFDGEAAHGPEELTRLPVRMLAVLSRARQDD